VKLPIPKGLERRLRPFIRRGEDFLREWEWTWTKAFVAAMIISFIGITTMAVIPSWMLYFSDSTFGTDNRIVISIRDIVVNGWIFTWAGIFVIAAYFLQKWRRRLRGEKQSERYSGGYR
jgi:hypothetical protein